MIAKFVSICDHDDDAPPTSGRGRARYKIGEQVWIGGKASVIRGRTIGPPAFRHS